MGDIFAGTGVKRYYAQHRRGLNDWEHPMAGYDTLEAARVDLAGFPLPGEYRIVEMIPFVNYAPGVCVKSRLLDNILEAGGFKPSRGCLSGASGRPSMAGCMTRWRRPRPAKGPGCAPPPPFSVCGTSR